ncbi:lytic transglycosylase domain-containing protein [Collinsella sp. zg1085]|nr:lytic transglycosylase domain-containing protein [Collinsella sp. zg1085]
MGLVAAAYSYGPSLLFRYQYPLSYEQEIASASERHQLDPYLVAAVISCESSWNPQAQSAQGAHGLMQILDTTAADMARTGRVDESQYPLDKLDDPVVNIEYGCAYLAYLSNYFTGARDRVIAAYNAGLGNVNEWIARSDFLHNAITFPETQAYLIRVNNAYDRYRQLYPLAFQVA